MARPRTIDRDAVLDAAQRVVARDGAARLTLEAVAAEAKISKASVLYDYGTMQALMKALIERRIAAEDSRIAEIEARLGPVSDVAIRARLASELRDLTDEDRSVALSLCALVAQDAELRAPVQAMMRRRIAKVLETSKQPRGALLAFLAIEGLMALEWLGLHRWQSEERQALISEIRWLVDQQPEQVAGDSLPKPT
jgi:AcrR family transcriptional regulator